MNQTELTLAIATALVVAAVLGWVLHWAFAHLNTTAPMAEDEALANLHAAEAAFATAEAELERLRNQYSQLEARMQAEVAAAMDGLGAARREASDLRRQLDELRSQSG